MTSKELQERYEEIKDMYLNQNISSTQIANIMGAKRYQINYILEKNGIAKTFSESRREYGLDEHYFDKINTPNKAYILGFLYADGYNNDINHTVVLTLHEKDKDILEKIRKELKCEKPLYHISSVNKYDGKPRELESLILASKHMSETIKKWGLIPNKTFTLEFPKFLPDNLVSHFIRGYFDGDGCAWIGANHNKTGKRMQVTIMSSMIFCQGLKEYITQELNIFTSLSVPTNHKKETGLFRIESKEAVKSFMNYIYKDADLYMERKYKKFAEYFANE